MLELLLCLALAPSAQAAEPSPRSRHGNRAVEHTGEVIGAVGLGMVIAAPIVASAQPPTTREWNRPRRSG
jgi:hypothetical protein